MSCSQCNGLEQETPKWAEADLAAYRRGKLGRTTRMLMDALIDAGVQGRSLLDIGGGIGAIPMELLQAGAKNAVSVEISSAYLNIARQEAAAKGVVDRIQYLHGDFVELADQIPAADIVTHDRVVCCYPDYKGLVNRSLDKAGAIYALVMPRDGWINHQVAKLENLLCRLQKSQFRTYIHPAAEIERMIRARGFKPRFRGGTLTWHVWVYQRA